MPGKERMQIVKALRCVDEVVLSVDKDQTQCETLKLLKPDIFAKGGDRFAHEIPEAKVCREHNIKIIDGLGSKIQSSSELIKNAKKSKN
jgi:bifunctional ADP-heptose synthase (sugar kinase/adenylyltransferase)